MRVAMRGNLLHDHCRGARTTLATAICFWREEEHWSVFVERACQSMKLLKQKSMSAFTKFAKTNLRKSKKKKKKKNKKKKLTRGLKKIQTSTNSRQFPLNLQRFQLQKNNRKTHSEGKAKKGKKTEQIYAKKKE